MSDKAAFVRGALFCGQRGNLELSRSNSASRWQRINLPSKTQSKLFANHNALGQLTNHKTFRFSEGGPSSNPELIEPFVWGWGERYCNNVNYVKNNVIFEPPSMRACSSTPPKQNQDFVKEHNRTPLMIIFRQGLNNCIKWVELNNQMSQITQTGLWNLWFSLENDHKSDYFQNCNFKYRSWDHVSDAFASFLKSESLSLQLAARTKKIL